MGVETSGSQPHPTGHRAFGAGLWRLADPKISLASFAGMFLGTCAAARDGRLDPGWLALTVAGIFAIEVAKNASGEIVDFESGTDLAVAPEDRSPFSGGKRVLVDGLLTRGQTAVIAMVSYALGIAAGLALVFSREPRVLPLGILGVACAFYYHAPPLKLSYRGMGEAAVGLCYGPLIACGTYLVQRGRVSSGILLASLPLGLLIASFLWINEFPDYAADLRSGKRTLVVRLGRPRSAVVFACLVGVAFTLQALLPFASEAVSAGIPRGVWLGLLGVVPAAASARGLLGAPEEAAKIIPAQQLTLLAFLLLAAGSGIGFLLT